MSKDQDMVNAIISVMILQIQIYGRIRDEFVAPAKSPMRTMVRSSRVETECLLGNLKA